MHNSHRYNGRRAAFTLIELAIVLVIIGLLVGGVLVGRDMISAAQVRAQVTQIEKYNSATNTFRDKFGYLPGDITAAAASQFGLAPRGAYPGEGDGNGIIEGVYAPVCGSCNAGIYEATGETALFWVDLSTTHLIDGGFNIATATTSPSANITGTGIDLYLPQAKAGNGNYVSVVSLSGLNYFTLSAISLITTQGLPTATPTLTVAQAYNIDKKIDDGYPQTGNIITRYDSANGFPWVGSGNTNALLGNSTTCYDNGGNAGTQQYSMTQNNGTGANCALMIKFQ